MKILFTGGGTGGHFYPVLAVIDAVDDIGAERHLVEITKHYMAATPYNKEALFSRHVHFHRVPAGKMRAYFSLLNFFDIFKTGFGILKAVVQVYFIFPDVVFSKGGPDSVPALIAARIFGIPVVIHESDAVPGTTSRWAGKFARNIAVGFSEAAQYFDHEKVAHTGNPVRKEILEPQHTGARSFFKLEEDIPAIVILGGSQGAQSINEHILDALPDLVNRYYVIHQTGQRNFAETSHVGKIILERHEFGYRYKPFAYLNDLEMKMAAGAGDLFIARAGASTIAELASWSVPAIIVPLSTAKRDHQRENAYAYARTGAAEVIDEANLTPNILIAEVDRLIENKAKRDEMRKNAKAFAEPEAAKKIADELVRIGLEHE